MDYFQYKPNKKQEVYYGSFKPYYKWITFNIYNSLREVAEDIKVLNLIINGLLSIL